MVGTDEAPMARAIRCRVEGMGEAAHNLPFNISAEDPMEDPNFIALYEEMVREDLCLFSKDILGLEIGPHIVAWGKLVQSVRRLAVNAARDHSKSTIFSYAYPIWRAWGDPGCEVYIFSKTLEQAQEFLDIILYGRDNLAGLVDIPALAHLVPTREDMKYNPSLRLNKSDVKLTNGSRIRAVGYGKAMRGRHPKYIVLDDPLNDEDMWSEMTRMKNIEYFKSAITNMLTPDGQLIVVGTPYHASDLYGWLRKNEMYQFIRFPGILKDDEGNERPLFPWRWPLKKLHDKKKEIGSVAFAREILCQPISDDISIFPGYMFPPCFDKTLTMRMTKEQIKAKGWITYFGVDIARSASVGADYFVIFVIARDPSNGSHIVMDIRRSKGKAFNKQLEEISVAAALYDPALIFIESNAMQQIYTDEMRRSTDLPVKEFVTLATNKYPLDKGVPGLRILLEGQKIIIPRGDGISRKLSDIWIDECTQFGFVDGKLQGIGEHDDTVMAWWIATEAAKSGGFSFTFGEGDDGEEEDMFGEESGGDSWEDVLLGDEEEGESSLFS